MSSQNRMAVKTSQNAWECREIRRQWRCGNRIQTPINVSRQNGKPRTTPVGCNRWRSGARI